MVIEELRRPLTDTQTALVRDFADLCTKEIGDPDELESADQWLSRLNAGKQESGLPIFHLALALSEPSASGQARLTGGMTFEYYHPSSCGLLTYVAVVDEYGGRSIAESLLEFAFETLRNDARSRDRRLEAVFGESERADRELRNDAGITAGMRLRIHAHLGAKEVGIPYVQPALSEGKARARGLLLMVFPAADLDRHTLTGSTVRAFLVDFYKALGCADPETDRDFQGMACELEGSCTVRELPRLEEPVLHFQRASVTLHFVSEPQEERKTPKDNGNAQSCAVFNSFQMDLLSHQYQDDPPLSSRLLTPQLIPLEVLFPESLRYASEGRTTTLFSKRTSVRVLAALSITEFSPSRIRVWHLTFRPAQDESFSEFDITKLSKLWGGAQEDCATLDKIRFREGKSVPMSLDELIRKLEPSGAAASSGLSGGTIELDMSSCDPSSAQTSLFHPIRNAFTGEKNAREELDRLFETHRPSRNVMEALCGIVTGIFDFDRMSFPEFIDTLEPTLAGEDMIRIHRGTLLSLDKDSKMMKTVWDTIGVSPYLIIPQALLLHNQWIVDHARHELKEVHQSGEDKPLGRRNVGKAARIRRTAQRRLKVDYLPNVFQYNTERELYERGTYARGTADMLGAVTRQIEELQERIDETRTVTQERGAYVISILLAFLSGFSLHPIIFQVHEEAEGDRFVRHLLPWSLFWVSLLAIAAVILVLGRPRRMN